MGWVPSFYAHCLLVWGTTSFAILIVHPSGITQWITHGQDNDKKNNLTSIPKIIKGPKVSVIQKYSGIICLFPGAQAPGFHFCTPTTGLNPPIIPEGPWTLLFRPPWNLTGWMGARASRGISFTGNTIKTILDPNAGDNKFWPQTATTTYDIQNLQHHPEKFGGFTILRWTGSS